MGVLKLINIDVSSSCPDHYDNQADAQLQFATPNVREALAGMNVNRAEALVALEAISAYLLPDVADVVVYHRYICPHVGLAREMEAGWVARGEAAAREEAEAARAEEEDGYGSMGEDELALWSKGNVQEGGEQPRKKARLGHQRVWKKGGV